MCAFKVMSCPAGLELPMVQSMGRVNALAQQKLPARVFSSYRFKLRLIDLMSSTTIGSALKRGRGREDAIVSITGSSDGDNAVIATNESKKGSSESANDGLASLFVNQSELNLSLLPLIPLIVLRPFHRCHLLHHLLVHSASRGPSSSAVCNHS